MQLVGREAHPQRQGLLYEPVAVARRQPPVLLTDSEHAAEKAHVHSLQFTNVSLVEK